MTHQPAINEPTKSVAPTLIATTPVERQLLWTIADLVAQNCSDHSPRDQRPVYGESSRVFSEFIAAHAEAIALLASYGLVTDLFDNGRRTVEGKLLGGLEIARILRTGPFELKSDLAVGK